MTHKRILTSLIVLASLVASPIIFASDFLPGKAIIGMDAGLASRSGKLNSNYWSINFPGVLPGPTPATAVPGTSAGSNVVKISDNGTTLGILAGYQLEFGSFFVGVEGHIDWGRYEQVKMTHHRNPVTFLVPGPAQVVAPIGFISEATYIQGTRYGATVRAGMQVPLMDSFYVEPYIRAGADYSDHELSITNVIVSQPAPLPYDHYTHNKGQWRALVGAGVEVPLFSKVVGLRLEYNYHPGPSIDFTDNRDALGATHEFKPNTHTGKLAVVVNLG